MLACTLVGAFLNGIFYAIPSYGMGEPWPFGVYAVLFHFQYLFTLATVGLALARVAPSLMTWLRRGHSSP